ncbi:MAG: hypothetical protein QNI89_18095 [Desulfobacterales bacterium]|nr:hypothetical protein [Desulfobacterales bacterium]
MMTNPDRQAPPSRKDITRQIERLRTRAAFKASPQQMALLEYVVRQTLAGKTGKIKGYTVATEVFGRPYDFDQNIDPIVSIQASRLRRALTAYYQGAGRNDPVVIDIPKGRYVPTFRWRQQASLPDPAASGGEADRAVNSYWPTVRVRPFENLSSDPQLDGLGLGLATEITHELHRYPDIRVTTRKATNGGAERRRRIRSFKLTGSVRSDSEGIKVSVQLSDDQAGLLVWSESHRHPPAAATNIANQEEIARGIAVRIAGHHGHVARALTTGLTAVHPIPRRMHVFAAVQRYYEYLRKMSPEAFRDALPALETAATTEPECGQIWSMQARLLADAHVLDGFGIEDPLESAFRCAQNGTRLLPEDQRAHTVTALIHLLRNDLTSARAEVDQALQLGPQTLFMLDEIGVLLTLLGEWERGPALIDTAIRLNPFHTNTVYYATWLRFLRRGHYDSALRETLKLNRTALFWDHLARAATYGLLGRREEGRRSAAELLALRPDFPDRGRGLIGHFIKFDDIFEKVVKGLAAAGVKVK